MQKLKVTGQIWNNPKLRNALFQSVIVLIIGSFIYYLYSNTVENLSRQNIASGFGFLKLEAGFDISDTLVEYWSDDTYLRALWVGFLNTLKVGLIGNFFGIILGVIIGMGRLSPNWLLSRLSLCYIEVLRNIPLLLQLFFWYAIFTEAFPSVKDAIELLPNVYLSQRGLVFPVMGSHPIWNYVFLSFSIAIIFCFFLYKIFKNKRENTGKAPKFLPYMISILVLIPVLTWLIGGAPLQVNIPTLQGFNFSGGTTIGPEFISLLLGLVLYTAAFNAEIVRAGILSVEKGQWEASKALGLSKSHMMGLIILPQALRVIIPPMTSQILNLTKNSSLAVGVGYPDFVSVASTTMNQTGQAIEAVSLIMIVYLFFSLLTSLIMNLYNRHISLKET